MKNIDLIDDMLKELDDLLMQEKAKLESDPESGEASMLLSQSFIDGLEIMHKAAGHKISNLKREIVTEKPHQEAPKELAEFKAEVLRDMRKTIRERFNGLLSEVSGDIHQKLSEELMKLDKQLIGQIASIRQELPEKKEIPSSPNSIIDPNPSSPNVIPKISGVMSSISFIDPNAHSKLIQKLRSRQLNTI